MTLKYPLQLSIMRMQKRVVVQGKSLQPLSTSWLMENSLAEFGPQVVVVLCTEGQF